MSQILVLIYQGLYANYSFIVRRRRDWIQINETSIEFGSQSRSWINIKTKRKQKNTQTNEEKTKQNVKSKNKTKITMHTVTFQGIVNVEKYIVTFCPVIFFSTDATHTYDIILNTDTISIFIPYSQWKEKNRERKIFQKKKENNSVYYFRERISLCSCDIVERRTNLMISSSHGLLNLQATMPSAISRLSYERK